MARAIDGRRGGPYQTQLCDFDNTEKKLEDRKPFHCRNHILKTELAVAEQAFRLRGFFVPLSSKESGNKKLSRTGNHDYPPLRKLTWRNGMLGTYD